MDSSESAFWSVIILQLQALLVCLEAVTIFRIYGSEIRADAQCLFSTNSCLITVDKGCCVVHIQKRSLWLTALSLWSWMVSLSANSLAALQYCITGHSMDVRQCSPEWESVAFLTKGDRYGPQQGEGSHSGATEGGQPVQILALLFLVDFFFYFSHNNYFFIPL